MCKDRAYSPAQVSYCFRDQISDCPIRNTQRETKKAPGSLHCAGLDVLYLTVSAGNARSRGSSGRLCHFERIQTTVSSCFPGKLERKQPLSLCFNSSFPSLLIWFVRTTILTPSVWICRKAGTESSLCTESVGCKRDSGDEVTVPNYCLNRNSNICSLSADEFLLGSSQSELCRRLQSCLDLSVLDIHILQNTHAWSLHTVEATAFRLYGYSQGSWFRIFSPRVTFTMEVFFKSKISLFIGKIIHMFASKSNEIRIQSNAFNPMQAIIFLWLLHIL